MTRFFHPLAFLLFVSTVLNAQEINRTDENGKKQGAWKKMFSNQKLRYEGKFKDDIPFGLFKYYYDTGKLKATNNHLGNGYVATHVYHSNGKIKAKGVFLNMKKDSLWQYFNTEELLALEETYAENVLHGVQRTYYDNAQLGEETNYVKGVKNGSWIKFFENGKPWVEASYLDGNLDGSFKMYNGEGKPKIQGTYAAGLRIGRWLMFNSNGSVRTQDSYANGVMKSQKPENGEFTEYYDNEIPKSIYNYKGGKKSGEFKEFYEKGEWVKVEVPAKMGGSAEMGEHLEGTQVKTKGWYHLDELNGKVKHYNEDGSVDRVEVWENGTLVSTIEWDGVDE